MSLETISNELQRISSKLAKYEQEVYSGRIANGEELSYADQDLRAAAIPELRKRKTGLEAALRLLILSESSIP